jgi:hypothetical protein
MLLRFVVSLHPPVYVNPPTHVAYAASITACGVHDGRDTAAGHAITTGTAGATTKVEVQLTLPQSSVTI